MTNRHTTCHAPGATRSLWLRGWIFGILGVALAPVAAPADVAIVDASGQTVASYSASYALVIGVSDYTAGWKDLPSIPGEMERVVGALEGQGFSVERLLNPDEDRLRNAIDTFVDTHGYAPDNRLLIFFAGHGYSREADGEQRGYLVPADAPVPAHTRKSVESFLAKAVPMLDVVGWARKMEARHVLFVFDSCFSGSVLNARSGIPEPAHITSLTGRRVRQFLTAGSAGEEVPGKSVFTPAFVRALEQGAGDLTGDGYVTGTELGVYLHQQVAKPDKTPQHGRLPGYHEGDFVFRLPFQQPPEVATFDLGDLEQRLSFESGWARYQQQMVDAHAGVVRLDSLDGAAATKAAAWERFLDSFDADNPLSTVDESLRQRAQARLAHWRRQAAMPTPEPVRQASPPSRPVPEAGDEMTEDTLSMRFRYIPRGTFQMGSPVGEEGRDDDETQHAVTLTRGFWMGETEVTQKQWRELMGTAPSHFSQCGDSCPVEQVSWYEAVVFANRLSDRAGLPACYESEDCTGALGGGCADKSSSYCEGDYQCKAVRLTSLECKGYHLPTEAEWEYAARADVPGVRHAQELGTIAWYVDNSGSTTHPVGQKQANAWGLHDMLGNVWEWSWDWKGTYPAGHQEDPVGPGSGSFRVLRGCSWGIFARYCRSASRDMWSPGSRISFAGFRLVRLP